MTFRKSYFLFCGILMFISFFSIGFSRAADQSRNESTVEKNKKEILRDIDLFEQSLHKTKSCISEARTVEELEKCRNDEVTLKLQRVHDMLEEIGMTQEERRMYELRPEKKGQ